jgi:hypothetical protein
MEPRLHFLARLDGLVLGVQEDIEAPAPEVAVDGLRRGAAVAATIGDKEPAVAPEGLQAEVTADGL